MAAFAGLCLDEIRGIWWEDDKGDVLNIRRSVWRTTVKDEIKTYEDEDGSGVVPIIRPLRLMLDSIRPVGACGWIFDNSIGGALDFENLADRVIKKTVREDAVGAMRQLEARITCAADVQRASVN